MDLNERVPSLALEQHLCDMMALSQAKYQMAITLMGPQNAASPEQLSNILQLIDDAELLVSDVASYIDSEELHQILAKLHWMQIALRQACQRLHKRAPAKGGKAYRSVVALLLLSASTILALV
jgi:hypothetical protein